MLKKYEIVGYAADCSPHHTVYMMLLPVHANSVKKWSWQRYLIC